MKDNLPLPVPEGFVQMIAILPSATLERWLDEAIETNNIEYRDILHFELELR